MLLFLLILHLNNVFSKCGEIDAAKFNESILLAQHYQNLRQVNAVLKDVQQKIHNISLVKEDDEKHGMRRYENFDSTKKLDKYQIHQTGNALMKESAKFHPSPNYDPLPTNSDRRQGRWIPPYSSGLGVLQSPLIIPRPAPGYRMAVVPFNPGEGRGPAGYLLRPVRSRIQPNPRLLKDFHFQNIYLRPPGLNMPMFTPRPMLQGFSQPLDTEINSIQESPQLLSPFHSSLSPALSYPAGLGIFQPHSTLFSSIRPTTREGVKIWMESLYNLYVPIFDKWKYVSKDQSPFATESTSKINDDQGITGAADNVQLFMEDGHGFLYLNRPEKGTTVPVPQYSKHEDTTTVGEIKEQDPPPLLPMQRYQALMERLNEGYMMVFMLELCRLIAMKNEKNVQQALHHMETIYNHLWNNGRLAWIDEPLQTVIWKLAVFISGDDIDVVRTDASMMFHTLLRRKQVLSPEVNSILDEADSFFDEAEGNQLFSALKEFENYPNTTKSSYWLCDSLIEGFMRPFRHGRQYRWKRRRKLMAEINDALKKRFPRLKEHSEGKPKNRKQRKRKRKRHRYPYKMLRQRKKPKAPDYNNEDIHDERPELNIDNENSILGTMTPLTSYQADFRAIPTKIYKIMKKSRKELNFLNRPKRIYSFNKRNKRLSYQLRVTTAIQEKHNDVIGRSNDTLKITKKTDHRHHHISRKTSTAKHRTPEEEDLFNNAVLPEPSSPLPFKKLRKDKTHIHQMKKRFKKHDKKRDTRSKLRSGLLRKISFFPTM